MVLDTSGLRDILTSIAMLDSSLAALADIDLTALENFDISTLAALLNGVSDNEQNQMLIDS